MSEAGTPDLRLLDPLDTSSLDEAERAAICRLAMQSGFVYGKVLVPSERVVFVCSPPAAVAAAGFAAGVLYLQSERDFGARLLDGLDLGSAILDAGDAARWLFGPGPIASSVVSSIETILSSLGHRLWSLDDTLRWRAVRDSRKSIKARVGAFFSPASYGVLRSDFERHADEVGSRSLSRDPFWRALGGASAPVVYSDDHVLLDDNRLFSVSRLTQIALHSSLGLPDRGGPPILDLYAHRHGIGLSLLGRWLLSCVGYSLAGRLPFDHGRSRSRFASQQQFFLGLSRGALVLRHDRFCVVSDRPQAIRVEPDGESVRLHCTDGPAKRYRDGWSIYAVHGVHLSDGSWIDDPSSLTVRRIHAEDNVEIRRVMIERYGHARYLRESKARLLQRDEFGTLWRCSQRGAEPLVMVEVLDSTPIHGSDERKTYFLRVPPSMSTARQAVAWTFDFPQDEMYSPTIET